MNRAFRFVKARFRYPYRKTIFRNMIIFSLFASVIPVIAVGFGSYLFSASAIRKEVNHANVRMLGNAASSIDKTLQRVQDNSTQMLLNTFFTGNVEAARAKDYAGFYSTIDRYLTSLQYSNKEVRSVTLYLADEGYLLSPDEGGKRVDEQVRAELALEMSTNQTFRWTSEAFPFLRGVRSYGTTLVCKVPLFSNNPVGLLFVHLDHQMFQDTISRFTGFQDEQVYILNEEGKLVSYAKEEKVPDGLFETVRQKGAGEERISFEWNRKSYLVSPLQSEYSRWTYLDMVPVDELNAKSRGIAFITLAIVAVFVLFGLLLVLWGSRRAYRPIEKLVTFVKGGETVDPGLDEIGFVETKWMQLSHTAQELQSRVNEQLPVIRGTFALQLLQGHFLHYSDEQLAMMLRRYELPEDGEHAVLVIAYDKAGGQGSFEEADNELIVFAIRNVAQHMLEEKEPGGIVIHLLNDQVAVWLWQEALGSDGDPVHEVKAFAESLRATLAGYLKLSVTVGMSDGTDVIAELPELYRQADMAARSRIIVGGNQVVRHTSSMMNTDFAFRYPVEIEEHFEQSLQLGDGAEAERMLEEFSKLLSGALTKPELITMSYNQLVTSAIRTAYLLGMEEGRLLGEGLTDPYAEIRKYHTLQELNEWVRVSLVHPIVDFVHGKRNQENERLIGKVIAFIEANYQYDLSLDQCAEVCGLSPHYLSKLFKKTMNVSFIEFLTALRLERAKELLRETELSVTEVSERVGYQPKNFIRVFKKHLGVTPGQFRESL